MTKNGVDVGETQANFLKKIEELTLYMIEQDKRLNAQQELIAQQQRLIEALGETTEDVGGKEINC